MAEGHTLKGLSAGRRLGRQSCRRRWSDQPLEFGVLEKFGSFVGSHAVVVLSDRDDMKACALNLMQFFRGRELRPVHALPRRHGEGGQADAARDLGRTVARRNCRRP